MTPRFSFRILACALVATTFVALCCHQARADEDDETGLGVNELCPDPVGAGQAACQELWWIGITPPAGGWTQCQPPLADFWGLPSNEQWTPIKYCDYYRDVMCGDEGNPVMVLGCACLPESNAGCAQALWAWALAALEARGQELAGEEPPTSYCDQFGQLMDEAEEALDIPGLAGSLGVSPADLKFAIALQWLEDQGGAWATEESGSLCGVPIECYIAQAGLNPSPSQWGQLQGAVGGSGLSCDRCVEPAGGKPKRWGWTFDGALPGDVNGNGVEWECSDLRRLLDDTLTGCYPPPTDPGGMTRGDVLDLAEEYFDLAEVACNGTAQCLSEWMMDAGFEPLTSAEVASMATAGDVCTGSHFPDDFIVEPRGAEFDPPVQKDPFKWDPTMPSQGTDGVGSGWPIPPDYYQSSNLDSCNECPMPGDVGGGGPHGTDGYVDPLLGKTVHGQWYAPVDLRSGDKLENDVDLHFPVTGGSFAIARSYRSAPEWTPAPWCGQKWTLSCFTRVIEDGGTLRLGSNSGGRTSAPLSTTTAPLSTVNGDELELEGPTHLTVRTTQVCVDGQTYPVYRVRSPGEYEIDYLRAKRNLETGSVGTCSAVDDPDPALIGLPIQRRDPYGNAQTYVYDIYDTEESTVARLRKIVCTRTGAGDPDVLEAEVRFNWIIDADADEVGRLRSVSAYRWTDDATPVAIPIARTEYLYFGDVDGISADVGSQGDLVQVTKQTRVDPSPGGDVPSGTWYSRVTQYRYHGGGGATSGWPNGNWYGSAHQLKLIIGAEQLEYGASKTELGGPATRLALFAEGLLRADDDEAVEDTSTSPLDVASKVIEAYETSGSKRVLNEYVLSGCGCNSAGAGLTNRFVFDYWTYTSPLEWTTRVSEQVAPSWEVVKATYVDMAPVGPALSGVDPADQPALVLRRAITFEDDEEDPPIWVTAVEYDDNGLPETIYPPSNLPTYERATSTTRSSHSPGSVGFAREFVFDEATKRLTESWIRDVAENEFWIIARQTWGGSSGNERPYLLKKVELFRGATSDPDLADPDDVEVTEFEYRFYTSGGDDLWAIQTSTEWDGAVFNGPTDLWAHEHDFFDLQGRNTWSRRADDSLVRHEFEHGTGLVTLSEANAAPPGSWPAEWEFDGLGGSFSGRNGDGGSLTESRTYDPLGRLRSVTEATGATTWLRRELRECADRLGILYLSVVLLPPELDEDQFAAPATIAWFDGGGQPLAAWQCALSGSYGIESSPASGSWPVGVSSYAANLNPSELLGRTRIRRSATGAITSVTRWHDPSEQAPGGGSERTRYFYDERGRVGHTMNAIGAVTRWTYDDFDRVVMVETGIEVSAGIGGGTVPGEMATIAEYVYDGSGDVPGVGNGNLTRIRQMVDSTPGNDRVTDLTYDYRDRMVRSVGPAAPFAAIVYDNLDRVIGTALYVAAPSLPVDLDDDDEDRVALTRVTYTQRGLPARSEIAIDPTEDGGTREYLASDRWHDAEGRVVGTRSPNAPRTKTTFDGLGRPSKVYVTDGDGDAAPGSGSHADVFDLSENEAKLTGDRVLEQTEYRYVSGAANRNGVVDLITHRVRLHDATHTSALTSSTSVATFTGSFHDLAGRVTHVADYGTNDGSHRFVSGTSAPTIVQDSPPASGAGVLVTETRYDARGFVSQVIDPEVRLTSTLRDGFGRPIAVIENDQADVEIGWGGTNWSVENASPSGYPDRNRVTSFVYDRAGNLVKRTAHGTTSGGDQVTEYVYGVEANPGDGPASHLTSNELPAKVIYPVGTGGSGDPQKVYLAWNRQGELIETLDQNGTTHSYTRDALGRVTSDLAAAASSPPATLDVTMDRVDLLFDDAGRLKKVTGFDSSTVLNEVEFSYTSLWQVERIYQHSKGAVAYDGSGDPTGDTRLVKYAYATDDATGKNFSRPEGLQYPRNVNSSGGVADVLDFTYGTSGGLNDLISRVDQLKINMSSTSGQVPLVEYGYLGLATPVVVDFPTPDVQLDRTLSPDGKRRSVGYTTQASGYYPAFDQFGRVQLQTWADGVLTSTGSPAHPTKPEIVSIEYGHDKNGNVTHAWDARYRNNWPRSHAFEHDALNRLVKARRNTWSNLSGLSPSDAAGTQSWTLDPLGNWTDTRTWTSGSTPDPETRTHNLANELTQRAPPSSAPIRNLGYDNAGNLASVAVTGGSTTTYVHDLWNRLVKVKVGSDVRFEQEFNGLTWRTLKREDTDVDGDLDEERTFTYSAAWQILDERVDFDYAGSPGLNRRMQYVWGIRYVDDCVFHRADGNNDGDYQDSGEGRWFHLTDAQFSTVAILDHQGRLVERVSYDSYGNARNHRAGDVDGDGDCDSNDKAIVDLVILNGSNSIGQANYRADYDLNRDGLINSTDSTMANQTAAALAHGTLSIGPSGTSAPDNSIGWCGYVFNRGTQQYLVRFRTFDTLLGRWVERDPAGYADGMSLYGYALGSPILVTDPMGLDTDEVRGVRDGETGTWVHEYDSKSRHLSTTWIPDPGQPSANRDKRRSSEIVIDDIKKQTDGALEAIETGARVSRQTAETAVEAGALAAAIAIPGPDELVLAGTLAVRGARAASTCSKVAKGVDVSRDAVRAARREFDNVVRPRYWKQEAAKNPGKYTEADLARMRDGHPPIGPDGHPMELHHKTALEKGGTNDPDNLVPMSRTDHRLGDNYKKNHPKD